MSENRMEKNINKLEIIDKREVLEKDFKIYRTPE